MRVARSAKGVSYLIIYNRELDNTMERKVQSATVSVHKVDFTHRS